MNCKIATIALLFIVGLTACSNEPPKCSDPETFALIRQIIIEKLGADHPATKLSAKELEDKLIIQHPRASSYDDKIKKYCCEATLITPSKVNDLQYQLNIEYESQLDDKKQHLVVLKNIRMVDLFRISQALISNINSSNNKSTPSDNKAAATPQPVEPQTQKAPVAAPTQAQEAPAAQPQTNTVEQTGLCKGLDLAVTAEQLECLNRKFTEADKQLNIVYRQVMAGLEESRKSALKKEQIAWIKEKETKCAQAGKDFEGGTMEPVAIADCKVQMTETRLAYLKNYK